MTILKSIIFILSGIVSSFFPLYVAMRYDNKIVTILVTISMALTAFLHYRAKTFKKNWAIVKIKMMVFINLLAYLLGENVKNLYLVIPIGLIMAVVANWYMFHSDDFLEVDKK